MLFGDEKGSFHETLLMATSEGWRELERRLKVKRPLQCLL